MKGCQSRGTFIPPICQMPLFCSVLFVCLHQVTPLLWPLRHDCGLPPRQLSCLFVYLCAGKQRLSFVPGLASVALSRGAKGCGREAVLAFICPKQIAVSLPSGGSDCFMHAEHFTAFKGINGGCCFFANQTSTWTNANTHECPGFDSVGE